MNKQEYADLLAEVSGGLTDIGIAARNERTAAEALVTEAISQNYWGVLALGDAIHQFYRDTVGEIGSRVASVPVTWPLYLSAHMHIACFARYAAAFDLLARGYYFDAGMLARGLWEVALSLAAIERGVVSADAIFGGVEPGRDITMHEIQAMGMRIDRKIQQTMIWRNANLDVDVRDAIEAFIALANLATHKSKLQVTQTLKAAQDGQAVPIFPRFDSRSIEWATNMLFMATWSVIATIAYLGPLIPGDGTLWHARYEKTMLAFRTHFEGAPKPTVKTFGKVVAALFIDRSRFAPGDT